MVTATLVALLRLIPYVFVAVNAWTKGYRWLTAAAIYVSIFAVVNFVYDLPKDVSGLLSSIFAVLLLMHALDLRNRKEDRK